jgi:UDPglucose 6-dehydrogenase
VSDETVCMYGLWHLGTVTAACLASAGVPVIGLDPDPLVVAALNRGQPSIAEPGLAELVQTGIAGGRLSFVAEPALALQDARLLWITFDTPVDDNDHADAAWVRMQLEAVRPFVRDDALVLVSSQVPVGFTRELERDWQAQTPGLTFACSPENLRLGQAIDVFRNPGRVVVGLGQGTQQHLPRRIFAPFCDRIEWMTLESAEMTKHALNSFLALSVVYTNELARICERVGAEAKEVERGLRSDPRIGERAYVSPGAPLAGGTLARDVEFLHALSEAHGLTSPLVEGIGASNRQHHAWTRERLAEHLPNLSSSRVALLGLTYKPGTDTLRRSTGLELGTWLVERGAEVRAFDPAVRALPAQLKGITLAADLDDVLEDADAVVVITPWPEFKALSVERILTAMRSPLVVDQAGFLTHLADDPRLRYVRVGRPQPLEKAL